MYVYISVYDYICQDYYVFLLLSGKHYKTVLFPLFVLGFLSYSTGQKDRSSSQ